MKVPSPCPFCGAPCRTWRPGDMEGAQWIVECDAEPAEGASLRGCGYAATWKATEEEAVQAHERVAGRLG